jgi:hypothetical protein
MRNPAEKPELTLTEIREIMNEKTEEKQLAINPSELMALSNNVAAACQEIVRKTAIQIKNRRYVRVEGWGSNRYRSWLHGWCPRCCRIPRIFEEFREFGKCWEFPILRVHPREIAQLRSRFFPMSAR